jgi:hypothetical protein
MPKATKTSNQSSAFQTPPSLLDPQQYSVCQHLALGKPPWSQRAKALLAISDGASETVAGELSKLRTTQVKFWLNKFNKGGMDIFPESLLKDADATSAKSTQNPSGEELPTPEMTGESKKSKKTKKSKGKKEKSKKKNAGGEKRSAQGKKKKKDKKKAKNK